MNDFVGKNLEDIQEMNRSLIIRFLKNSDVTSRAELAAMSKLKQATITNIVNDFISWGLVEETGLISRNKGRRSIGIRLCKEKYKIISVRLSRNYITITVSDMASNINFSQQYDVDAKEELQKTIEFMITKIKKIIESFHSNKILGVGVAMPGPWVKSKKQVAYFTGFYKWQDINIADMMEKELNLPVYLDEDANIALLAECSSLDQVMVNETILCVMVGQGIGAGIMSNGMVLRGHMDVAGEIGHMSVCYNGEKCECGNKGCLEGYASTSAVVKKAREIVDNYPETVLTNKSKFNDILKAYHLGDILATEVIDESARYLGYALASLTNVLNPGLIIIGDEMSKCGENYLNQVISSVRDRVSPTIFDSTIIKLSTFALDTAVIGAAELVINETIMKPTKFILCPEEM
ncbi:MAG: ROK family protein [Bacillota bacterium]|nr:ROK family protein [Bacillota bacterium]